MRQVSGGGTSGNGVRPHGETTVYVVHQDAATRAWLEELLQAEWIKVACLDSAEALLAIRHPAYPACVVANLRLPGLSGLELQRSLAQRFPCVPVLLLTEQPDVSSAVAAMKQGAFDFVVLPVSEEYLVEQVHDALAHGHALHQQEIQFEALIARLELLSERENQVLEGLVRGGTSRSIGKELGVSPKTVEMHRSHVYEKMHAGSVAELVQMYCTANYHKALIHNTRAHSSSPATKPVQQLRLTLDTPSVPLSWGHMTS